MNGIMYLSILSESWLCLEPPEIASLPTPPPEVNLSPLGFGVGAPPGANERGGFGETSGASKATALVLIFF